MRRQVEAAPVGAIRRVVALLALAAVAAVCGPASADAEVAHVYSSNFSVTGNPVSMAVDDSTGYVYVLNSAGNILRYDASGNPANYASISPPSNSLTTGCTTSCRQIAVDNSGEINQGLIYVGNLSLFSAAGTKIFFPNGRPGTTISNATGTSGLIEPFCGVAVDSSGVVYVTHSGNNQNANFIRNIVNTYKPDQIFPDASPGQEWPILATFNNVGNPNPCRTAVDSNNHLYLAPDSSTAANQFLERPIVRMTVDPFSSSEPPSTLFDSGSTGMAVDQSTNDVYSNHKTSILRYDEEGNLRETFGVGNLAESGGIAVNGTNGTVYAANRLESKVQVFTTVVTPNVDSISASASQTTATLAAHVDTAGAGDISGCEFEYGTTTTYASPPVPCDETLPYTGEKDVGASLSSLSKETTYHYRLVLTNANGTTKGSDHTFTTHNVAGVATGVPTEVTQTSATLNGSFIGNGEPTSFYFQWGPTEAYGNETAVPPGEPTGEPTGMESVSAPITGLSVYLPESQPYHFRLVAVNSSGTTYGPDRPFFSAPPADPVISGVNAAEITPTGATVSATVNPQSGPTVYWIEYGLEVPYGSATTAGSSIGEDETDHPVSTVLSGLIPGKTYHYRLVASNFGGVSFSTDGTFNTPAAPVLNSPTATAIGQNVATLGGEVNPGFSATSYHFDYGLTRSYGLSTPERTLANLDNESHGVSEALTGLRSGVIYHYRLVASNPYGTVEGPDQAFTTEPVPPQKEVRHPIQPRTVCKKGFVKRHGKCVRKHKRHRRHKRHHARGEHS